MKKFHGHQRLIEAIERGKPLGVTTLEKISKEGGLEEVFRTGYAAALIDVQEGEIVLLHRQTLDMWADFAKSIGNEAIGKVLR